MTQETPIIPIKPSLVVCKNPLPRIRRLAKLKQGAMAKLLGMSSSAISHREREESLRLRTIVETLNKLNAKGRLTVEMEDGTTETFKLTEK